MKISKPAIIFLIALIALLAVYINLTFRVSNNQIALPLNNDEKIAPTTTDSNNSGIKEVKKAPEPKFIPESWKIYKNADWGIAFAYPSNWTMDIGFESEGRLGLLMEGDGYAFAVNTGDRELSNIDWTHPQYFIGDKEAQTWQADRSDGVNGYRIVLRVQLPGRPMPFIFGALTPDKSKEISDKILATINFSNK